MAQFPSGRPTADAEEFELAISLVEKLSSSGVEPEAYTDLYRTQVLAMLEEKSRGHHHCPTASGTNGKSSISLRL